MFMENGLEVYINWKLVEVELPQKMEMEQAKENRHSTVYELIERTCNAYWRIKKEGNTKQ
ncbi:7590_t:CDS:1, partial [Gigaspora margarita]